MPEPIFHNQEETLDQLTRIAPHTLDEMAAISRGYPIAETESVRNLKKWLVEDPVSFHKKLVEFEIWWAKQLNTANQRDERIAVAEEKARRMEEELQFLRVENRELKARLGESEETEPDEGTARALALLDRLAEVYRKEMEERTNPTKAETRR